MQKPVKVLVVVCQMNLAGLECRVMDIIRRLDYEKICLDVFSYRMEPGIFDEEITALGGTVYYNPPLSPKNMFWYMQYFKEFLLKHPEYQIIHAHQDAWCTVFCKGAYLAGVPVRIAHSRTAISKPTFPNMVKNLIRLPARRYATHYFAVSALAGEWLFGKKLMEAGKVEIWKNAIDCRIYQYNFEERQKKRAKMGWEEKKIIIHVGNFTVPKNQNFLIDIIKKLRKMDENWTLVLVGGETKEKLKKNLEERVKKENLQDGVRFLGVRNDVPELLQAADVFCFPSIFEGLPGSVLEAQASGLPCIISSSITEEVRVLETTKVLSLKDQIEIWVSEITDSLNTERRDTFDEMVRAGFDIEKLTNDLINFYETVGRE